MLVSLLHDLRTKVKNRHIDWNLQRQVKQQKTLKLDHRSRRLAKQVHEVVSQVVLHVSISILIVIQQIRVAELISKIIIPDSVDNPKV